MSDGDVFRCAACSTPLGGSHHMFGFQRNQITYSLPGETPSEQALMKPSILSTLGRFCCSACCKQQLASLLEAQGLPSHLQHNRVYGGPIAPCGKCGKPVNMSQPHGAWIKGKVTADIQNGVDAAPDWFDVLTVVCASCVGPEGFSGIDRQIDQKNTFEQLIQELAEHSEADDPEDHMQRVRGTICGA